MTYSYEVFHGSDFNNIGSILAESFRKSEGEDEWLGHGVYFFVEGISDPTENAIEWAKNQAYSKGEFKYKEFAVFKAVVVCDKVLDVTNTEGLKAFNALRNMIIEKHDKLFERNRDFQCDDRVMWNLVATSLRVDAVKHNLYIKDKTQRVKKIRSNTPNTTVLCVKSPDSIVKDTIEIVCHGDVK